MPTLKYFILMLSTDLLLLYVLKPRVLFLSLSLLSLLLQIGFALLQRKSFVILCLDLNTSHGRCCVAQRNIFELSAGIVLEKKSNACFLLCFFFLFFFLFLLFVVSILFLFLRNIARDQTKIMSMLLLFCILNIGLIMGLKIIYDAQYA